MSHILIECPKRCHSKSIGSLCTRSWKGHLPFDLQDSRNISLRHINSRRSAHYDRKGLIAICKSHHVYATNITHTHTYTQTHIHAHIPLRLQLRSRNSHRLHYLSIERYTLEAIRAYLLTNKWHSRAQVIEKLIER